jgi:hypothetical protein
MGVLYLSNSKFKIKFYYGNDSFEELFQDVVERKLRRLHSEDESQGIGCYNKINRQSNVICPQDREESK